MDTIVIFRSICSHLSPNRRELTRYISLRQVPPQRLLDSTISSTDSRSLFENAGYPVPGVEHKWSFDRSEYDEIRREQKAERAWLNDHPECEPAVDVDLYPPGTYTPDPTHGDVLAAYPPLNKEFSDQDCLDALRAATEAIHQPELTTTAYEEVRERVPGIPSSSLIQARFGTWSEAKDVAGVE